LRTQTVRPISGGKGRRAPKLDKVGGIPRECAGEKKRRENSLLQGREASSPDLYWPFLRKEERSGEAIRLALKKRKKADPARGRRKDGPPTLRRFVMTPS